MDTIDAKDKQILALLQEDAMMPATEIADRVGLSTTPCWRRIQKLEEAGFIRKRVALLDRERLNVPVSVFVAVRTSRHATDWFEAFNRMVQDIPEIVEAYRMSGEIDYLLRVVVADIAGFDSVYKRMIDRVDFADVSSSFSMEELKYTTAIPLDHAPLR